jgi:rubredoxin
VTEDELRELFDHPDFGLDGSWSSKTQQLIAKFGAESLELNKWWALTPQNWKCPSCDLPKQNLARLSKSRTLIAKLVSHHDHATEWVETLAPITRTPDGQIEPTSYGLRQHLKKIAYGFLSRFNPTIICEQCNNLEAELKKRFGIPTSVTLAPSEIGKLKDYGRATSNLDSEQLISELHEWADFSVKHIELARSSYRYNLHSSRQLWLNTEKQVTLKAATEIRIKLKTQHVRESDILQEFLSLSVAFLEQQSVGLRNLPSQSEFFNFRHPDPKRQKVSEKTPDNWKCPVCLRNKFECFRASRNSPKKFMLNLYERVVCLDDGQFEYSEIVCGDCNDFQNGLTRHCRKIGIGELFGRLESRKIDGDVVRQSIKSAPHQPHVFDYETAVKIMSGPDFDYSDADIIVDF